MRETDQLDTNLDQKEISEKVVEIKRVSKKTKGGNQISFTALVVVGNGQGEVGFSLEGAKDVASAIKKAAKKAKKKMIKIPLKEGTIPHQVEAKFKGARVLLKPARPGTGLIVGGPLRIIASVAGIEDLVAKMLGSKNKAANVQAAFKALSLLKEGKR